MAPPLSGPGSRGPRGMRMRDPSVKLSSLGKGTIKRFLTYFRKYRLLFFIVVICIIASAAANVAGSLFIKNVIDNYITPMLTQANPNFSGLLRAILKMACIYIVGIVAAFGSARLMIPIAQGILKTMRDEMFSHMQTLPIKYFDTHAHGDIMSRYTNDTDTLRQMITQGIPQILNSAITIICVLVTMLVTSAWLTLLVLAVTALSLFISMKMAGASGKFFVKQQASLGDVNGFVEEMINGQRVIKVFCHEDKAKEEFDAKNDELFNNSNSANIIASILMPILGNLGNIQYVLIAIIGGTMAVKGFGGLTLGTIAAFLTLSQNFTMPINQISQQLNAIVMALAGAERIFILLDEKPETDNGYVTLVNAKYEGTELVETNERTDIWAWKKPDENGQPSYTKLTGDVSIEKVDFGYEPDKQILHGISMHARPGKKVALVGATGAGKTTITNLVNRFYDINSGKIHYDGIDISEICKPDLRRSLAIVLQDVNLFTGTILENIRYGRLDATDEECIAAAQLANAHDFIMRLPDGYDTMIDGDGGRLSQGQRQLLSIARAAVADPPVMILDEATSSIDTRTESIVQRGMDALMSGRTVFVIAHRLSTVQNSDSIIVLEDGTIIERGNHESLLAERGKYYQLYTGAFELE